MKIKEIMKIVIVLALTMLWTNLGSAQEKERPHARPEDRYYDVSKRINPHDTRVNPVIERLSPESGPASGGTMVHLYGFEFRGGIRVLFGNTWAKKIVYVSDKEILAQAPPHARGTSVVFIYNTDGTGASLSPGFSFH